MKEFLKNLGLLAMIAASVAAFSCKNASDSDGGSRHSQTEFAIFYKANGGSGEDFASELVGIGEEAEIESCSFSAPAESFFAGWNTKADGSGDSYEAGEKVVLSDNLTLYAQWLQGGEVEKTTFDAIAITYATGDDATHVTQDMTLPESANGANLTWTSDNHDFLSDAGAFTPKIADKKVTLERHAATLTASFTVGGKDYSKKFTLNQKFAEYEEDNENYNEIGVFDGKYYTYEFEEKERSGHYGTKFEYSVKGDKLTLTPILKLEIGAEEWMQKAEYVKFWTDRMEKSTVGYKNFARAAIDGKVTVADSKKYAAQMGENYENIVAWWILDREEGEEDEKVARWGAMTDAERAAKALAYFQAEYGMKEGITKSEADKFWDDIKAEELQEISQAFSPKTVKFKIGDRSSYYGGDDTTEWVFQVYDFEKGWQSQDFYVRDGDSGSMFENYTDDSEWYFYDGASGKSYDICKSGASGSTFNGRDDDGNEFSFTIEVSNPNLTVSWDDGGEKSATFDLTKFEQALGD